MFGPLQELYWEYRRRQNLPQWQAWRRQTLTNLLKVFPDQVPYHFDVAPSFLMATPPDLDTPNRVDLILPRYPLAIDLVPPGIGERYDHARPWFREVEWERLSRLAAEKQTRLHQVNCPYLRLYYGDPVDPASLRERVHTRLGRYP